MKKLLIFMLVLGMASAANAVLTANVDWYISDSQLIGEGVDLGLYDGFLMQYGAPLLTPVSVDKSLAGNASKLDDWGDVGGGLYVISAYAEDIAGTGQIPGVWFVLDIIGVGTVDISLDMGETIAGSIFVPEPATIALLGLGGMFLLRRRR